jgi:succinate dehydrogenase/fumarate reductase flavoprotein subunit
MSDTKDSEKPQEEREPTPEEVAAYRAEMDKFYDEQLPLLKKQREYEITLADIEEARTRKMTMVLRQIQLSTPPPPEDLSKKTETPGERKLKQS